MIALPSPAAGVAPCVLTLAALRLLAQADLACGRLEVTRRGRSFVFRHAPDQAALALRGDPAGRDINCLAPDVAIPLRALCQAALRTGVAAMVYLPGWRTGPLWLAAVWPAPVAAGAAATLYLALLPVSGALRQE